MTHRLAAGLLALFCLGGALLWAAEALRCTDCGNTDDNTLEVVDGQ